MRSNTTVEIHHDGELPEVRVFPQIGPDQTHRPFVTVAMEGFWGRLVTWEGSRELVAAQFTDRTRGTLFLSPECARGFAHRILEALGEVEAEPEMEQLRRTA